MDYGKAQLNKDDFLADMKTTYDKSYGQWLLSESRRIIQNRFILYGIALVYFLILALLYVSIFVTWEGDAYDLGQEFARSMFAILFIIVGTGYCIGKIKKTFDLKKDRTEMENIFVQKYSGDANDFDYSPSADPVKLAAENSKICRAVLRAENYEEAESILKNESRWKDESAYGILTILAIFAFIGSGFLIWGAAFVIYYIYTNNKMKEKVTRATLLAEEKFGIFDMDENLEKDEDSEMDRSFNEEAV